MVTDTRLLKDIKKTRTYYRLLMKLSKHDVKIKMIKASNNKLVLETTKRWEKSKKSENILY